MDRNIQLPIKPLISIIIPVFNSEKYLAECLESAINQTWTNKEIIIVDDGSTDGSIKIAQNYAGNPIVKIIRQKNKGAAAARNAGLKQASGDYIQFLDADDLLKSNKIAVQVEQLAGEQDILCTCPVIHFADSKDGFTNQKPDDYELSFYSNSKQPFEFLLKLYGAENDRGGMIPIHCWLSPSALINKAGNWNEDLTLNDDGDFFCRLVLAASGIINTGDTVCYYRKDNLGNSLSAQKTLSAFQSQFHSIQLINEHLKKHSKDDKRIEKVIARMLTELLYKVYPSYPELTLQIEKQIQSLGGTNYKPVMGGPVIEKIKSIFGWKFAKHFQQLNPLRKWR